MHSGGKLTAEERVEGFFDAGTYREMKPWTRNRCADLTSIKRILATRES